MMKRILAVLAALAAIGATAFALHAEEPKPIQFQRVFVVDSMVKPANALQSGHFVCRVIDKDHPALLSAECQTRIGVRQDGLTRALTLGKAGTQVFICPHCGRLIWHDTGRDIKLTQQIDKMTEQDLEAVVKITTGLAESAAGAELRTSAKP